MSDSEFETDDILEEEFGDMVSKDAGPELEPEPPATITSRHTYHVKPGCSIKQGGKEFTEGEPVELTASQAERLRDHVA